jgi:hypothetical protein
MGFSMTLRLVLSYMTMGRNGQSAPPDANERSFFGQVLPWSQRAPER